MELGVTHLDEQFLSNVLFLHIPVESHMVLPSKFVLRQYLLPLHLSDDVSLVHKICDDLLKLLSQRFRMIFQHAFSQLAQEIEHKL